MKLEIDYDFPWLRQKEWRRRVTRLVVDTEAEAHAELAASIAACDSAVFLEARIYLDWIGAKPLWTITPADLPDVRVKVAEHRRQRAAALRQTRRDRDARHALERGRQLSLLS